MIKRILAVSLVLALLVAGAVGYALFKPTAEASGPIEAIPLDLEATTPPETVEETVDEEAAEPATEEPAATATTESAYSEATPTAEAEAAASDSASEPILFEIDPSRSQARYIIDEELRGAPTTVVGTTNQVAGQLAIDPNDPSTARVGTLQINARTLQSDESRRDQALQNRILFTNQFEFITFEPTAIIGLPESAKAGESYSFQVVGDLTIRDQTREVTWDVTVDAISESELEGTATTTIPYAEWGLAIPNVPFVANVSDTVRLELDWVATAQ